MEGIEELIAIMFGSVQSLFSDSVTGREFIVIFTQHTILFWVKNQFLCGRNLPYV